MTEIEKIHPVAALEQFIEGNPTSRYSPRFDYYPGAGSLELPCADLNGSLSRSGYPTKSLPVQYGIAMKTTWTRGVELTGQFNSQPMKEVLPPNPSPSVYEIAFAREPHSSHQPIYNCRGVSVIPGSNWITGIALGMRRIMSGQAEITSPQDRRRDVDCLKINIYISGEIQTSTISFFPGSSRDLIDPIHHLRLKPNLPLDEQIAKYVLISQALLRSLPENRNVQLNHHATNDLVDLTLKTCQSYANLSEKLIA